MSEIRRTFDGKTRAHQASGEMEGEPMGSAMDDAWNEARLAVLGAAKAAAESLTEGDWAPDEGARIAEATKDLAESYAWLTSTAHSH